LNGDQQPVGKIKGEGLIRRLQRDIQAASDCGEQPPVLV